MTLNALMQRFAAIYGVRNAFLTGLPQKVNLLFISTTDVQNVIRRARRDDLLAVSYARLFSRVGCIVEHFRGGLPLTQAMMEKFPSVGCAYCHTKPCTCGETRPDPSVLPSNPEQADWTLADWSKHMSDVYGERNRRKGIDYVMGRLTNEIGELLSLAMRLPELEGNQEQTLHEFSLELADVISWIMTSANVLSVDLEQAVARRYKNGCTSCQAIPCTCAHFSRRQVSWDTLSGEAVDVAVPSEQLPRE